jgi:two-component system response regulator AtoC
MHKVFDVITQVAASRATVLITGESGTGKELVAKTIHATSPRADKPFVPVNTGSMPVDLLESTLFGHVKGAFTSAIATKRGLFEVADQGTIFFDEIGTVGVETQAKLLRVIQEREFMKVGSQKRIKLDIRIIASSNRDLNEAIKAGAFREDLYYRLSVIPIHLPPLRERTGDIPLLVNHFLRKYSQKGQREVTGLSSRALRLLTDYAWPGNVRELEHTIERIVILEDGATIQPEHLPSFISPRPGEFQGFSDESYSLEELEKRYIRFILRRTKGRRQEAARILGINRKTLSHKINKYKLEEI